MSNCKVSKICGGCQYIELDYQQQLQMKQENEEKLLKKFGKVNKIIGMDNPFNYRNKVQVSFGMYKDFVLCGNYVTSTHKIVDISNCLLCDDLANKIIHTIKNLAISLHLSIFDEHLYKGCLRHVLIRTSGTTKQVMVVLVTGSITLPKKEIIIKELLKKYPEITTIVQNINNKRTSMILSDRNVVLYGKGYIEDVLCDNVFQISPNSFYQVNSTQTEILYSKAIELAHFEGNETIIDAYCGTGTIGICASNKVKKLIGVEINKQAIHDAIKNAKRNEIENAYFVCDDAGNYMTKLAKEKFPIDAVIMDPPRAGADKKFLSSLVSLKPKKIIYISCNPITLKENLNYLTYHDYKVEVIQPVDMFPHTEHVETIIGLCLKENYEL